MANTPEKLLSMYERGVFTHNELVFRVIEETYEPPTAELIAFLPVGVVDCIREMASRAATPRSFSIVSCCTRDPEGWDTAQREAEKRFGSGLSLWRDHFGFTG